MKNTVVAGGGVLGSQIAFQSAYCGCAVTIWLRSEGSIGRTQPKLAHLRKTYLDTIDATADASGAAGWARGTGAPKGPFQILDTVGLTTAHNIVKQYLKVPPFLAPYNFRGMDTMLRQYLDAGKLGMSSGEGIYRYPQD